MGRIKTKYPGVYYREVRGIGSKEVDKVYYIVFKKDGKMIEEKVGREKTNDMTAARASKIRGQRIDGEMISRKEARQQEEEAKKAEENKWTIARLWEEYKARNPDLKGIVTDENRFHKHIEPDLGGKEPKELISLDVDRIRIGMGKTHKPATVRNALELLRRIVNFGVKKQLCDGLSFQLQMPTVNNQKTEDLTPEQLVRLMEILNTDHDAYAVGAVKLALFTGVRRGEMFRLQWPHVDWERGFILLVDPKGGKDQKVPLNDAARRTLEGMPRTESLYVFPGRDGGQRVDLRKSVNRIKRLAGLPKDFRPLHGHRHVFASNLASSGEVDLYTLQRLLTHKSPQMTQRYAHLRDEALKAASDLAGSIIDRLSPASKARGEDA
jgi:integrase